MTSASAPAPDLATDPVLRGRGRTPVRTVWRRALNGLVMVTLLATHAVRAQAQAPDAAPADVTAQILALEQRGRALARESSADLDKLKARTGVRDPQRLELLTVQGLMLAIPSEAGAAERPATELDEWGQDPTANDAALAGAAARLIRARELHRGGNVQRADTLMREAMARLPQAMAPRDRMRFVMTQANIKDDLGRFEDSVRLNHEALALADAQDALWLRSDARAALASSYFGAQQYERARTLARESLALAERAQDWYAMARAQTVLGIVLDALGDRQGQRRAFELAIEYAHRSGAKREEVGYMANLADFYLKTGEYKTALAQSEQALPLAREMRDPNGEKVALANIGLAHISLRHFDIGKRYVRESMAIDEKNGTVASLADFSQEVGGYLEKAGDLPGAVAAFHRHRQLAADVVRDGQQKAILAMQEQYDADQRARELVLLNRESAIKAERLRRHDLQQGLWWLVAAAGLLLLAVVSLLYRKVRRSNRQLTTTNELLKAQSERDPLTGLANRRHFQAVMQQLAADGQLNGTVYLIDIDHFKHINDRHGHSAGDTVLIEVARRLREALREPDLIVRWGGEEFLVVAQGLVPAQVEALAQRMLGVFDQAPVVIDARGTPGIPVTASIGFATFPLGEAGLRVSWERAVNLVDTAMYLAKAHGRNRAYGVRLLQAQDEASLAAVTASLESAWREGKVTLTLLQGRAALAVAA